MKKALIIAFISIALLALAGCSSLQSPAQQQDNNSDTQTQEVQDMNDAAQPTIDSDSKTLVIDFSATGNTKALAEKVAQEADADLFEIVPAQPYTTEDLDYNNGNSRATVEQNDPSARPAIASLIDNLAEYDTVLIGHPIWWDTEPRIIDTFIETNDLSGKTIGSFCTSGSSDTTF